jgi:hypothetical protein
MNRAGYDIYYRLSIGFVEGLQFSAKSFRFGKMKVL